jgi:hypothetical protein
VALHDAGKHAPGAERLAWAPDASQLALADAEVVAPAAMMQTLPASAH